MMIKEFAMPKLGTTMTEGAVAEWYITIGDYVSAGEIIVSIESNKSVVDVESTFSGYLRSIQVENGEVVPIGAVIAYFTDNMREPI